MSVASHACPPPRRSTWEAVRALARTNPTIAEAVGLVDNNGLSREEAMLAAVIELDRVNQQLVDENMALRLSRPLPDRDDDDHCIRCRLAECPGCAGEA